MREILAVFSALCLTGTVMGLCVGIGDPVYIRILAVIMTACVVGYMWIEIFT